MIQPPEIPSDAVLDGGGCCVVILAAKGSEGGIKLDVQVDLSLPAESMSNAQVCDRAEVDWNRCQNRDGENNPKGDGKKQLALSKAAL